MAVGERRRELRAEARERGEGIVDLRHAIREAIKQAISEGVVDLRHAIREAIGEAIREATKQAIRETISRIGE